LTVIFRFNSNATHRQKYALCERFSFSFAKLSSEVCPGILDTTCINDALKGWQLWNKRNFVSKIVCSICHCQWNCISGCYASDLNITDSIFPL